MAVYMQRLHLVESILVTHVRDSVEAAMTAIHIDVYTNASVVQDRTWMS